MQELITHTPAKHIISNTISKLKITVSKCRIILNSKINEEIVRLWLIKLLKDRGETEYEIKLNQ